MIIDIIVCVLLFIVWLLWIQWSNLNPINFIPTNIKDTLQNFNTASLNSDILTICLAYSRKTQLQRFTFCQQKLQVILFENHIHLPLTAGKLA